MQVRSHLVVAALMWAFVCAGAWGLGSFLLDSPSIINVTEVWAYAARASLYGFLVAAPLAVGGSIVLRRFIRRPAAWAAATLVGVPLGLLIGFLINAMFLYRQVHAMGMALAGEGGGATMAPVAAITLVIAGIVLGLTQAPALAPGLIATLQSRLLWILGVAGALGVGWFLSASLAGEMPHPALGRGVLMGAVNGAIVFGLLLILEREQRGLTTRWSRPRPRAKMATRMRIEGAVGWERVSRERSGGSARGR